MERDILKEIIAYKREEVEAQKRHLTANQLAAVTEDGSRNRGKGTTHYP